MKKYKLLKDIPGHKAGEIFEQPDEGGALIDADGRVTYIAGEIHRHPDIMDWFEEVTDRWKPKEGQEYYGVDESSEVYCFINRFQSITDRQIATGNCFRTKEEAEKHLKWLKAVAVLRADAANQHPEWKPEADNWFVAYDRTLEHLGPISCGDVQRAPFIFDNKADAERSATEHKAEWLTFLGVD